jgi:hypothetical protein
MRYLLSATVWFVLASTSNVLAQSKADEEAVSKLPQEFCEAWAKHDGHALAKIMAEDVDFVTVATTYLHGRTDFETFHVRLLSGRFKDSTITVLKTTTVFYDRIWRLSIGVGKLRGTETLTVRPVSHATG